MKLIYRLVLVLLLAFMFRTPLWRLQNTASHLLKATTSSSTGSLANRAFSTTAPSRQNDTMAEERPTGLIANKGLELLSFGTPNGHKASIILEELKEAYGKPSYVFQSINIGQNIQVGIESCAHTLSPDSL